MCGVANHLLGWGSSREEARVLQNAVLCSRSTSLPALPPPVFPYWGEGTVVIGVMWGERGCAGGGGGGGGGGEGC